MISEALKKIGVTLDTDIKSLIISGDLQMINELLKDIYVSENKDFDKISVASSQQSKKPKQQSKKELKQGGDESRSKELKAKPQNAAPGKQDQSINNQELEELKLINGQVDLSVLDVNKNLSETTSILEFLLVGLCKHLNLKVKQAMTLLSNNGKYLAHVLVKGVKSNYEQIQSWLQDIYINIKRVMTFIEVDEANMSIIFQSLKPGLLSKNEEVALWSLRIYSKMSYELANMELLPTGYEWFCRVNGGGLHSCVLCLHRHPNIKEVIVSFMLQIGRYNVIDLLTVQLRKVLENPIEYLSVVHIILKPLAESDLSKEELVNGQIIDLWCEIAERFAENDAQNTTAQRL